MRSSLTNLLPIERQRSLSRDYALRFAALSLTLLASLALVHGALLAPTYLYMRERAAIAEERLAELSERRAVSGFEDLTARVAAFSENASALEKLATAPSASGIVRGLLEVSRTGVSLESLNYTAPSPDGTGGSIIVSGIASSREALRNFDQSVSGLSYVETTDLPLSAYAKETDIAFTMKLMLTDQLP
jgi:Tfp pilus assembly protein PilN